MQYSLVRFCPQVTKSLRMAQTKFEYTRHFEQDDRQLPNTWLVVRIDGRSFTKFTETHGFQKPNDERGLRLMNECAKQVLTEFGDVALAYGESDEYSFVLRKSCGLYGRRASKIVTAIVSTFSGYYTFLWQRFLPDVPLQMPATFDGRIVCYPSDQNLRDYLSWRQADCHINNLYNTTFWALVHSGVSNQDAFKTLNVTSSGQKNEILFSRFGINYNDLPAMYRKGSIVLRSTSQSDTNISETKKGRRQIVVVHEDLIGDAFWQAHQDILVE